jgi:hypothetical protein
VTEFSSGAELTLAGLYEETELEDGWWNRLNSYLWKNCYSLQRLLQ